MRGTAKAAGESSCRCRAGQRKQGWVSTRSSSKCLVQGDSHRHKLLGQFPLHSQLSLERKMVPRAATLSTRARAGHSLPFPARLCIPCKTHSQGKLSSAHTPQRFRRVHRDNPTLLLHPAVLPSLNSFSATNPRFAHLNQSSINILFKKKINHRCKHLPRKEEKLQ